MRAYKCVSVCMRLCISVYAYMCVCVCMIHMCVCVYATVQACKVLAGDGDGRPGICLFTPGVVLEHMVRDLPGSRRGGWWVGVGGVWIRFHSRGPGSTGLKRSWPRIWGDGSWWRNAEPGLHSVSGSPSPPARFGFLGVNSGTVCGLGPELAFKRWGFSWPG